MDTGNAVLASSFPEPVTTLSNLDHKVLESDSQDGAARMVIHGGLSSRGVDIFPDASLQSPVAACWQFLCTGDLLRHGVDPCGHVPHRSAGESSGQGISHFAATPGLMTQNTFLPL